MRNFSNRFEWKIYDFDRPPTLRALLASQGFIAGEPEAFMVYPLTREASIPDARENEIRVLKIGVDRLKDIVAVQEEVHGQDFAWLFDLLSQTLANRPEELSIYCAYFGNRAVGTGWTCLVQGSVFADLHGGAVVPDLRGQGIYSRLFGKRVIEAQQRGFQYMAVDAAPMSRPILERKGFIHVCGTYPMRQAIY